MAKPKRITRACNMVFVPLNQLNKMTTDGCYIPIFKQGVSNDAPRLTDRERECLTHFVDGLNIKTIAQTMDVSERRIQLILESLRNKFSVNTDHWIITRYFQMGLDTAL